jgi:vacuolar protein sorting-associated protein 13A/C
MSLTKMGKASERVRFLDELDLTLSLDSRQSSSHQMTSIELAAQPIVLRASYRDINLISTISTHALQLYSSRTSQTPADKHASSRPKSKKTQSSNKTGRPNIQSTSSEAPRLLMSKERVSSGNTFPLRSTVM